MTSNSNSNMTRKEKIIKEIKSIVVIVLVIFAFRSTFFEPFRIPSGSMIPTLMIGDFILVNKFSYGFKVPFSDLNLSFIGIDWKPIYITDQKDPARGDVVVFKFPRDPSLNYIKRVIGLPGDKIEVINKVVYVNGTAIVEEQVDDKPYMDDMDDKFQKFDFDFFKTKTGTHEHIVQKEMTSEHLANVPEFVVPADHYFVMGDNRDFSSDSRVWGFVPKQNIKGKAILVWFSMIFPFGEDDFKFRPHRIGNMIP